MLSDEPTPNTDILDYNPTPTIGCTDPNTDIPDYNPTPTIGCTDPKPTSPDYNPTPSIGLTDPVPTIFDYSNFDEPTFPTGQKVETDLTKPTIRPDERF